MTESINNFSHAETPIQKTVRMNQERGVLTEEKIQHMASGQRNIEFLRENCGLKTTDNRKAYQKKKQTVTTTRKFSLQEQIDQVKQISVLAKSSGMIGGTA